MTPLTCTDCGERFAGYKSFAEHRTERFQHEPYIVCGRRCLTETQMREVAKLEQDAALVWHLPNATTGY